MVSRPFFSFQQAQYVQVSLLKPAPFCTLLAGLGSTNKPATSFILVSDSRSVLPTLSSPPSFLLPQTLWQIWQELSSLSCSIRLQWVFRHSFLLGNDAADEMARREALLVPSAISCSLSLISRIHSCLFSDWRHTVSSKFFNTQVPSISIEELALHRHARCVLSRLHCNGHSLRIGSYLSRIGRIENPPCSACGHTSQEISHLILHCPATDSLRRSLFGNSLSLSTTSGPDPGELPGFGAPWSSAMPPSHGRGRVNNKFYASPPSSFRAIKIHIHTHTHTHTRTDRNICAWYYEFLRLLRRNRKRGFRSYMYFCKMTNVQACK